MALPTLTLEVAFATAPFAAPTWTDVTTYWEEANFQSPRRSLELDQVEPGGGDITFDNPDRRFEPEYASGAYYPNVKPIRRVRLTAVHSAVTYYPWAGYIETWPPIWETFGSSEVRVQLLDAMESLARLDLVATYSQEASGTRIANVLNSVGFPSGDRVLDAGQSTVIAKTFVATDEKSALEHIRDVVTTEGPTAAFFIDGQGRAVFHDRHKRLKSPYTTSQATFGDSGSEIPYEAIQPKYSKDLIFNDARVTREGGTTQTSTDSTSQTDYFHRSRSFSTLHTSDTEPADFARFVVARYKDPALRFDAIEVAPLESDTIWPTVLGLDIGERVTVKRRPPQHPAGAGGVVSKECVIEGIQWIFPNRDARAARVRYLLTPADQNQYWVLGDAVNGLLGTTTKLAF